MSSTDCAARYGCAASMIRMIRTRSDVQVTFSFSYSALVVLG